MNHLLRRFLAAGAALATLLAFAPAALSAPPTSVTIGAPAAGSLGTLSAPSNAVTLTASANASAGAFITQIDFRVNGTSVGVVATSLAAPTLSTTWTPSAPGTYNITAIATDSSAASNNTLTSATTTVTVTAVRLASVTQPVANTTITQNSQVVLRATASMSDGAVQDVEFFLGGASLGAKVTSAPYFLAPTITTAPGSYNLVAKATASDGTTTWESTATYPITVISQVGTSVPVVTFVSPATTDIIAVGTAVTITATATDADGFIPNTAPGGVSFYADGELVGTDLTAPYSMAWTPTVAKSVNLVAVATDDKGNTQSATRTVTVLAVAPTVSISAPANNSSATVGTAVTVNATATAGLGTTITSVQFLADGVAISTDTTAPYSASWTPAAAGTVALTAKVTDSNNTVVTSSVINVNVAASPGTLAAVLTAPTNGTNVALGTTTNFTATATTAGTATVAKVDFLVASTIVGTALSAPYSATWTPTATGIFAVTARVTDSNGLTAVSSVANVNVTGPSVTLTAPAAGTSVTVGSTTAVTATASAVGAATVTKVDFFAGTVLIGTANTAPYSVNWIPSTAGTFSLTARVTDSNSAAITSTAVSVTVATSVPTVSVTAPTNGASVALGTTATISANATAAGGATVSRVDFLAGATVVGTALAAPYSISWTPTASGIVALTAKVTDTNGTSVTSTIVNVNVTAPSVSLTSPVAGAGVTVGLATTLTATASSVAPATISKVDFFAGTTLVGTANSAPYTVNWTPTATGSVSLTARVTDSNAGVVTSTAVSVTVAVSVPTVSLTAPTAGASVGLGAVTSITATAAATGGATVSRVDFLAGTTTIGTAIAAPYSVNWTPTASGITALTARVTDSNGTAITSAVVNVNVTAPSVALTGPTAGAGVTLGAITALTATATPVAPATITKVDFFAGTVLVGTSTVAPYTVNWTPTANGTVSLTARVTDSNSGVVTSTAVSVTVATSVPSVSLTNPAAGASLGLGAVATLTATAIPTGGATVSRVDFLAGTTTIGTSLVAPYTVNWTPTVAGITALTARVTDSNGTAVTSASVNVTVTAPSVAITAPTPSTNVLISAATTITATASAVGAATVTRVDFLAGTTVIGSVTTAPYSVVWTPTAVGAASLTARVTDSNGAVVTSSAVAVTVAASGLTVSITSPTSNATLSGNATVTLSATAAVTAPATIASVAFLIDGNQVGVDTAAPFAVQWVAAPAGLHTVTARVTDSNGNTLDSTGINVTVNTVSLPTVFMTAPTAGTAAVVGAAATVSATAAAGSSGSITKVDFYADTTLIGTDTSSPYSISWIPTTAGAPNISARVTDSNGVTANSVPVPIIVNPAGTPTITLSMVGGGGSLVVPVGSSRMLVAATADDGVVNRVDFYLDGVLIGTDGVAPYTFNYIASTDVGPHQFTAVVTDNSGLQTTSNTISATLVDAIGSAPTVRVLTPADGAFATSGSVTTVNVVAADTDGTISRVEVFANGILLPGTALANRIWSTAWTPTSIGPVSITAIATDDKTNATVAAASNVTVTDNSAPTVILGVTPGINAGTGTTLPAGATRNVVATVFPSVAGRAITRVEFFINGTTKVGEKVTAPYSYRFTAPSTPGIYVLTARGTDNGGLSRDVYYTFTVTESVGVAPTVRLLTPTANTTVIPNTPVTLAASAIATGGTIANVQFYANGNPVGNPIAPPTSFSTNYNPTTPGGHTLDAIATDDRGNTTVSNSVNLTAAYGTPTVVISSPSTNVTARATPLVPFAISATATAGTGASVFLVEFLVDGQQVGTRLTPTTAGGSIYTFQWIPTVAQLGAHQITARVTDTNSLTVVTPVALNVNVANPVGAPPSLSVITPANGTILQSLSTVNFTVNAAPGAGATITSVEFFLNDVSIGTGQRQQLTNVYRRVFDLTNFDLSGLLINEATGRYPVNFYAVARDNNGNQTIFPTPTATNPTPAVLNISPSISTPPTVTLESLVVGGGGNAVTIGTPFFMTATPLDSDGTVTTMQLFVNGVATGGTIVNPQSSAFLSYTPTLAGNYNLYVVATDDSGNTAVSSPVLTLNVTAIPAPNTQLVSPSNNNTTTTVNAPVFLEATAVGANITQVPTVQFIASATTGQRTTIGATRVGTTTTYRAIWTPFLADTYTIISSAAVGSSPTATSALSRRVVVNDLVGISPTISISVPGTATSASTANLTATAIDSDGAVSSVEFFLDRKSIGFATRDQLTNTWRLSASMVGLPLGPTEIRALVRDSSDNVAASANNFINVVAATSLAPTFTTITATPNSVPTGRQMQFTANARDTDGTVSVQYFLNGVNLGSSSNPNNSYLVNWTPTTSGTFTISAVATDNSSPANTAVAIPIQVTVRRSNPIQDDTSFIIQTYSDIANTTTINPLVTADLADRLAAGTLARSKVVIDLMDEPGFLPPVNLLATYWVLMGQWPTPTNYNALLATTRAGGLSTAVNSILFSNEYFLKYGIVPTVALLNSPTSVLPADTYINSLWRAAGLGAPSVLQNVQFRSNNQLTATLGRGYNSVGLPAALAEFVTNTNSLNTTLFARARAAALYYQLNRPLSPPDQTAKQITDAIATRVDELVKLTDDAARIDACLKDVLYFYRYVTFVKHPQSLVVNPRSGAIFTVEALGAPPVLYQWLFNGTPIPNATTSTLSLTNVDASRVGTYTVVVTTTAGSSTSDPATLALTNAPTRVANISTRGVTSGGNQTLIGGFVVANPLGAPANQTRQMLIRVVGPALANAPFNVAGTLANPSLELYNAAGNIILTNDNWGTQTANAATNTTALTALQQAGNRIGAFALPAGSSDAAVLATLAPGSYTVQASGPNANSTGVVLIEVYDATATATTNTSPRASNVATRGTVGTGSNILIAGFVINGTASRRVLLRGVGPTLTRFGLGQNAVLADPLLTLKDAAGNTLRTNDDWASGDDAAAIAAASVSGGAFALTNGSKDAAMLVMLAPGAYTVQLSGVNNTTGIGIVEVYDVDP